MIRAAVIAGTPVDTQMGVEYIRNRNAGGICLVEPVCMPVSGNCDDQIRFQYSSDQSKRQTIEDIFRPAIGDGIRDFFIYCNSLSGAFDFDAYETELNDGLDREAGETIHIYTPLQVYRRIGSQLGRVGVIAANNLSAYNIEKTIMSVNDSIYVIGSGNMAVVSAIEAGEQPEDIIRHYGLVELVGYMESCGCEAIILGCTHFPYFKNELAQLCRIPLIDPADEMYDAMIASSI